MRNNLGGDITKSDRMNTQCMFECDLCWLAPVLPTGIYIIYITKLYNIYNKYIYIIYITNLVCFQRAWYINF